MKMKMSDIIRKSSDETMAKIIGAVVSMNVDGISDEEALEREYPHTLRALQYEMDVDYTQTNADKIRAMNDEELADFLEQFEVCSHCEYSDKERCTFENPCVHEFATAMALNWLQSEAE